MIYYKNVLIYLFNKVYEIKLLFMTFMICIFTFIIETSILPYITHHATEAIKNNLNIEYYIYTLIFTFIYIFISYRIEGYYLGYKMPIVMRLNVTRELMDILFTKNYIYYEKYQPGELSDKINNIIDNLPYLAKIIFYDIIRVSFGILFAGLTLLREDRNSGLIFFAFIGFAIILMYFSANDLNKKSQDSANAYIKNSGKITDVLYNILGIKLFSNPSLENKFVAQYTKEAMNKHEKFEWAAFRVKAKISFICLFFQIISIIYSYHYCCRLLPLVLMIYSKIAPYIFHILRHFMDGVDLYGQIAQSYDILNNSDFTSYDLDDFTPKLISKIEHDIIIFDNASFECNGISIIKNLSFKIQAGDHVVFIGKSGAGKSTILKLILKLYDITGGNLFINRKSIHSITRGFVQSNITAIPQDSIIFNRSIFHNLLLPENYNIDRLMEIIKILNLDEIINSFDDLLNIKLGVGGFQLSGGQIQRLCIARTLCKIEFSAYKPKILLIDEATSALDTTNAISALSLIHDIACKYNITTILITHNLDYIKDYNKVIILDKDENGTVAQVGDIDLLQQFFY